MKNKFLVVREIKEKKDEKLRRITWRMSAREIKHNSGGLSAPTCPGRHQVFEASRVFWGSSGSI